MQNLLGHLSVNCINSHQTKPMPNYTPTTDPDKVGRNGRISLPMFTTEADKKRRDETVQSGDS